MQTLLTLKQPATLTLTRRGLPDRTITVTTVRPMFRIDTQRRFVTASLHPAALILPLYGPRQFARHASDTEEMLLDRLDLLLGDDPQTVLQAAAARTTPWWMDELPLTADELALEQAETLGIELPLDDGTVTLAASDRDRALFSSALVLYRTYEDLLPDEPSKAAFRDSLVTFADAQGATRQITVTQARQLLVQYGGMYQTVWAEARKDKGGKDKPQ